MYTQNLVALIMLFMGLAQALSWDIVVGARNKLEFYNNGTISQVEDFDLEIKNLAFDVVHNRLLLVDGSNIQDTFIYSFNIATKEKQSLVKRKRFFQFMSSIAYDPAMEIFFWTDPDGIYSFSLKAGSINNVYGNVLIKFDNSTPWTITVDSCKGYIYWATVMNRESATIEKARFDGSGREIVLADNMRAIRSLIIDQQTQKMYWSDDVQIRRPFTITPFSIQSADLNGENRTTLYIDTEKDQPKILALSKDSIYWIPWVNPYSKIWQIPKKPTGDTKPEAITVSVKYSEIIATNYKIEDQIQGIQGCEPLRNLLPKNKETEE